MEKLFKEYCKEGDFLRKTYIEELNKLNEKYKARFEKLDGIEKDIKYWVEETYSTIKESPNDYFAIDWEGLREQQQLYVSCITPGTDENLEYARIIIPADFILKTMSLEEAKKFVKVTR